MGAIGRRVLVSVLFAFATASHAGVDFVEKHRAFLVTGFPEGEPGTLTDVMECDAERGLGLVRFDSATQTFAVEASLWIGDPMCIGSTFFQLGTAERPREALAIAGDVWIRPPMDSVVRRDGRRAFVSRLTGGVPHNPAVAPRIVFRCEKPSQYGLMVGHRRQSNGKVVRAGDLFLYHTTVTAAVQDRKHDFRTRLQRPELDMWGGFYGSDIRLVNSTFSFFTDMLVYGLGRNTRIEVRGCVFEDGHTVFGNVCDMTGCTFRRVYAPSHGGDFVQCRFEDNVHNARFDGKHAHWPIVLTDCLVGEPRRRNPWKKYGGKANRWPVFPRIEERRTLVFSVADARGVPIKDAMVEVRCDGSPGAVVCSTALTGAGGRTPDEPEDGAILLVAREQTATETPGEPDTRVFSFGITVTARGFRSRRLEVRSRDLLVDDEAALTPHLVPVVLRQH